MEQTAKRRKLNNHAATKISEAISAEIHSDNVFALETAELLKEVVINDYKEAFPQADQVVLRRIKTTVEGIEGHDALPFQQVVTNFQKKHKIAIPFPHPKPSKLSSNFKLSLAKPEDVNIVGSYVLKTMLNKTGNHGVANAIDMVVVMPESMFQEKDYLNMRYIYKRAYFLAHIAAALSRYGPDAGDMELEFDLLGDNSMLPVLVVKVGLSGGRNSGKAGADAKKRRKAECNGEEDVGKSGMSGYAVRVIPCAPESLFPKRKLLPTSNGIRPSDAANGGGDDDGDAAELPPTPFYNSTMIAEMSYMGYLRLLHHTSERCKAFRDACILGRIWLQQRGIGGRISQGGFGHFEFSTLMALLLRPGNQAISASLNAAQLFKTVLKFLALNDFAAKPYIFGTGVGLPGAIPTQGPALFDGEHGHNIAYKMARWSVALLRQHAQWCMAILGNNNTDQFSPLFITKANIPQQMFDCRITVADGSINVPVSADRRGDAWNCLESIHTLLTAALGDRVDLVHFEYAALKPWNLDSHTPAPVPKHVRIGLKFTRNMTRKMDKGPNVEDQENAKEFQRFWGDRSELRRFPDGSMSENGIWKQSSACGICEEIVRHVLALHLKLDGKSLEFSGNEIYSYAFPGSSDDDSAFVAVKQLFGEFEHALRGLKRLPLQIKFVAGASPELRYASLQLPPSPTRKDPSCPVDVVVSFETSGKWPDNIIAIQRTKIAFLQRIAKFLEDDMSKNVLCRIGLEESPHEIENQAFLDVTIRSTITFRMRIHTDLEESMLEKQAKDKTAYDDKAVTRKKDAAQALAVLRRDFRLVPMHTQTMQRFHMRHPMLSSSTRLLKHWFACQKLSNHFSEELIELFASHAFLHPYPWGVPCSPVMGFLRALWMLSRWDWRVDPLVLDFTATPDSDEKGLQSDETIDEDLGGTTMLNGTQGTARTRLAAWRQIDPNMKRVVMVVATNYDASGTGFTGCGFRPSPSAVAAARMNALAKSACKVLRATGIGGDGGTSGFYQRLRDPEVLFRTDSDEFDVMIKLSPALLSPLSSNANSDGGPPTSTNPKPLVALSRSAEVAVTPAVANSNGNGTPSDSLSHLLQYATAAAGGGSSTTVAPFSAAQLLPPAQRPYTLVLDLLQRTYGDVLLFFHGVPFLPLSRADQWTQAQTQARTEMEAEATTILAVWNPMVRARTFRTNLPCSFMPAAAAKVADGGDTDDEDEDDEDANELMQVNRLGILAEIARIGAPGGLVTRITQL